MKSLNCGRIRPSFVVLPLKGSETVEGVFSRGRHAAVLPEAGSLKVLVEVGLEGEGLLAVRALEVFESRVGLHVGSQVRAVGKGLPTVGAPEGLLARMGAHMALQEPGPGEGLAAHLTLVTEIVRKHVHGKRWH